MLILLLGTGLFLSVRCGFPQLKLRRIWRDTLGRAGQEASEAEASLSPFRAMTTALAGTVGTGNIAGVTGAVFLGGPGAVFWMWAAAFFGMCTKYAEIALALRFRRIDGQGRARGGPMYAIDRGLGRRFRPLALCFSLAGGLAGFGIGNLAQSSEIAGAARALFGAPPAVTGVLLTLFVGTVLRGGVRRVGRMTGLLVPLMAGLYLLAAVPILLIHARELPDLFRMILRGAFSVRAAGGGALGVGMRAALRHGLARGVFSNEAGLGSAPMAHAASSCRDPGRQASWGVLEVFLDSFVVCTLTALVVLLSGIWRAPGGIETFGSSGEAAAAAFRQLLPGLPADALLSVCLLFFALSSLVSWGYYGEVCWTYLCGDSRTVLLVFRLVFALLCVPAALFPGQILWAVSDALNGLMAFPNLIALLLLSPTAAAVSRRHFAASPSAQL